MPRFSMRPAAPASGHRRRRATKPAGQDHDHMMCAFRVRGGKRLPRARQAFGNYGEVGLSHLGRIATRAKLPASRAEKFSLDSARTRRARSSARSGLAKKLSHAIHAASHVSPHRTRQLAAKARVQLRPGAAPTGPRWRASCRVTGCSRTACAHRARSTRRRTPAGSRPPGMRVSSSAVSHEPIACGHRPLRRVPERR